jgi:hypothetical protein
MKSILFVNSSEIQNHPAWARAALQIAWVSIALLVVIRGFGGWNFETTLTAFSPPCLFHLLTGMDCPGCGMTRAFLHLAHGDIRGAWYLHPFSPFLALLLLGLAWGPKDMWSSMRQSVLAHRLASVGVIILLSWWLWAKVLPQ